MKIIIITILTTLSLFTIAYSSSKRNGDTVQSLYEKGLQMTEQLDMLAESEDYIKMFSYSPEVSVLAKKIGDIDYNTPKAVYKISGIDTAYMKLLLSHGTINLSQEIKDIVKDKFAVGIASIISSQNGAIFLATTAIITVSDSFIYSGIDEQETYLFLYGGEYASVITFTPFQENIVISSGSIVINESFAKIKTVKDVSMFFKNAIRLTELKISRVTK